MTIKAKDKATPRAEPKRQREVQHIIRTTDAEAQEIENAANHIGLKKATWARMVLLREARRHASKG